MSSVPTPVLSGPESVQATIGTAAGGHRNLISATWKEGNGLALGKAGEEGTHIIEGLGAGAHDSLKWLRHHFYDLHFLEGRVTRLPQERKGYKVGLMSV